MAFLPYMLTVFMFAGSVWLGVWILPVYFIILVSRRDWRAAAAVAGLWLALFWIYRRFRLGGFIETPPSVL